MWTKKGHLTGQKKPFKLEDIWRIRTRLEIEENIMELALLNLAIDCKLRSCDLLRMKVRDISSGGVIQNRVLYSQSKTGREVQFEITSRTAQSLAQWIMKSQITASDYVFPSSRKQGKSMSYSRYLKIIRRWATKTWLRLISVWYSLNAPNESNTHLYTDKEHPCGSIIARTRKTRQYHSLSWC